MPMAPVLLCLRSTPKRPVQATAPCTLACRITGYAPAFPMPPHRLQRLNWSDPSMHRAHKNGLIRVRMEAWRMGFDPSRQDGRHVGPREIG